MNMKQRLSFVTAVCAVLLVYYPGKAQEIFEETPGLYSTRRLQTSLAMETQNKLIVQSASTLRGEITITTAETAEVSVDYFKKAKAESESKAIDYIDLIAVRLERVADGVRLRMSAPNPAPWSEQETGLVAAEVVVPESCFIEVEAAYFDVAAQGPFAGMIVSGSLGKLEVRDVTGLLDLETANQRVSVERVSGDISVSTSNADLTARKITCPDAPARFRNDGGDIRIEDITGKINVKNNYGRITISDFEVVGGSNFVRGFSGPVVVDIKDITDGQVVVTNRFEDIEITVPAELSARFSLAVDDDSKIEVTGFPFQTDLVQPDRLNLVTGDGAALISASIRGQGNIFVRADEEGN
jgi:hypothetical protein